LAFAPWAFSARPLVHAVRSRRVADFDGLHCRFAPPPTPYSRLAALAREPRLRVMATGTAAGEGKMGEFVPL